MKFLKDEKTRRIIVSGSILVVLYFLLNNLSDIYGVFTKLLHVMSPFIVGAAIAYILNVPMRKVERGLFKNPDKFSGPKWHGRRRALAIFITISIAFLVIGCVLYMVIPQLADTIAQLIKQIPAGVQNVTVWAENTFSKYPVITEKIDYWAANWQNILESITTFVKNYKITPDTCVSGFECLDKVKDNKYDLILMDDMMPKMSGVETFKKLKEDKGFNTPVIILTANAVSGMKEKYLNEGFNDYLAKPIDKLELDRVLGEYLKK